MKILMVNKFHYLKGGSEKYYFDLAKLLEENGHEVAFFSMKNDKNIKTNNKEYFVEEIDLNSNNKLKALEVIYSNKNKKKMEEALDDFKPDIVHLNNFQRQLSASIIKPIKKRKIPIVFTAHDIEAVCPNKTMLDSNNKICEKCLGGNYYHCIKKKCIKESKLKSILGAIETWYYRLAGIYTRKIDCIITPSEFYKNKLVQDGIKEDKIQAIHNFIDTKEYDLDLQDEGYGFYFGRISEEKGIFNLLKALKEIKDPKFYIAGDGPQREEIEKIIKKEKMEDRIKLLGFLSPDKVKENISKCRFVVLPSIWRDNCPYSIMETMAIGKPVIGSRIGGIPELVKNDETGFLFDYENIDELKEKMKKLYNDKELALNMGNNAKSIANQIYTKEYYYNKIIEIYERLV